MAWAGNKLLRGTRGTCGTHGMLYGRVWPGHQGRPTSPRRRRRQIGGGYDRDPRRLARRHAIVFHAAAALPC
jgi:hypothetical protein